MIEGGSLILTAAAIYLFECLVPVRRDAIAFRTGVRRARPLAGDRLPGLPAIGVAVAFPLPPLGPVLVCPRSPPALSPAAVDDAFDTSKKLVTSSETIS